MIKVLIVEDSRAMRRIIARSMEAIGYQSDVFLYAEDGEQGLALLLKEKPALVLTDLHMPKMSGIDLVKAVRAKAIHCKIGIISVDSDPTMVEQAHQEGADFYLIKPFTVEQLRETLNKIGKLPAASKTKPQRHKAVLKVAPPRERLIRVLSSFGYGRVELSPGRYEDFHLTQIPIVVGTLQNGKKQALITVLLDGIAANLVTALIMRHPLGEAMTAAQKGKLSAGGKQALETFMGLLSVLYQLADENEALSLQGLRIFELPEETLQELIDQHRDTGEVLMLSCGEDAPGQILFLPG